MAEKIIRDPVHDVIAFRNDRPAEALLLPADLAAANEAFLSSSVAGILPVTTFDGRAIGSGQPGPWTLRARRDREAFVAGS